MVGLWLRAAVAHTARVASARSAMPAASAPFRCAGSSGWLLVPHRAQLWVFLVLAAGELAVPIWAEAAGRTSWNPRHIAERYGLFTIIVLGRGGRRRRAWRSKPPSTRGRGSPRLATWWSVACSRCFRCGGSTSTCPSEEIVVAVRRAFAKRLNGAFAWGYGHFVIFASVAATGAGLAVAVDQVTHHSGLTKLEAAFTLTVPVCTYLTGVWALHAPYKPQAGCGTSESRSPTRSILASSATPQPVLATGDRPRRAAHRHARSRTRSEQDSRRGRSVMTGLSASDSAA